MKTALFLLLSLSCLNVFAACKLESGTIFDNQKRKNVSVAILSGDCAKIIYDQMLHEDTVLKTQSDKEEHEDGIMSGEIVRVLEVRTKVIRISKPVDGSFCDRTNVQTADMEKGNSNTNSYKCYSFGK